MANTKITAFVDKVKETVKPLTAKAAKVENVEKTEEEIPQAKKKKKVYKVVHQSLPSIAPGLAPLPGTVPQAVYVPIPKVKSNG